MEILIQDIFNEEGKQRLIRELYAHHLVFTHHFTQEQIDAADVILGNPTTSLSLCSSRLKLLQLHSAGSERYVDCIHKDTLLCNASGCYGSTLSEHACALLMALCRQLPYYIRQMDQHHWKNLNVGKEINQSNVCIVGCGDIGRQLAKRLSAFNCHITGIKRRGNDPIPYFERIVNIQDMDFVLNQMDIVILCLPQTKQTIGLFDEKRLLSMKKDAILINVGRGSAIVHDDLVKVLPSHLFGVGLDVTDPEPLPKEDSLWDNPKVIITPHSAGGMNWPSVQQKYLELCLENIHRIQNKKICLNVVDRKSGYRENITLF